MSQTDINAVRAYFLDLQDRICNELETVDGKSKFIEDKWQRDGANG